MLRIINKAMVAIACSITCVAVYADDSSLEEVTIIGSKVDARKLSGTAAVVDREQIKIENANDINQLLKTVPGIYVMEEDGYGLRPNIGIRGATSERSGKITVLEDGIPIAPAPYTAASAYYFPTTARMTAIEVLKGTPLLRYGPQTTGGVINLVSSPIPDELGGRLSASLGENSEGDLLLNYGGRVGEFGFLLETTQRTSDGFKSVDRFESDTGYEIEDYLIKLSWKSGPHNLLLKGQYSEETSDETYTGLTDKDFDADPYRRYGLSKPDQMNNDHEGYLLSYTYEVSDSISLNTKMYRNEFARDWWKISGVGKLVNAANDGDLVAQGILDGSVDKEGMKYKHNNRSYTSEGFQVELDVNAGLHNLSVGFRSHEDDMDRFQPQDVYNQTEGMLVYDYTISPSGSNNRLEDSEAISFWVMDNWQINDRLLLNLALRYEDVESSRREFSDKDRTVLKSERSNDTDEWLPGASFTYDISDQWQILAGVHKGFSPLGGGAKETEEPETSVNWEAGLRYRGSGVFLEAVGFVSNFDNKSENCSNASPCSNGATSGQFVTGEAEISGMEFTLSTIQEVGSMTIPIDLMYTYTSAEISEDNSESGYVDGDMLAAIPENTAAARIGLIGANGWGNYLVFKYTDWMCMDLGCNRSGSTKFDRSEDLVTVDFISRYPLDFGGTIFLKVENLFDEERIITRQPDGARPNKAMTARVGFEWNF